MIEVTRLNGTKFLINPDLLETVEETPDTVLTFVTGKKFIVTESRQELINLVILYKQECFSKIPDWKDKAFQDAVEGVKIEEKHKGLMEGKIGE